MRRFRGAETTEMRISILLIVPFGFPVVPEVKIAYAASLGWQSAVVNQRCPTISGVRKCLSTLHQGQRQQTHQRTRKPQT